MGIFHSKHKNKSRPSSSQGGGGGGYNAERPASNGRTGGNQPIDPRQQRQQRPQQYRPQQQRQQYQPAPAPTGQRRDAPNQQPAPQPQTNRTPPKNIHPEYYLEVYCLTCCKPPPKKGRGKGRGKGKAEPPPECRVTPRLNRTLENPAAYRDAWNKGPSQKWRLGVDFCSWDASSGLKNRAAEQVITRTCRVQDGWESLDSLAESRFGRIMKTKEEVEKRGPFCVDKLLDDLKKRGVDFVSSV